MVLAAKLYTAHAVQRLYERYGMVLKRWEMEDIARACMDGRATLCRSTRGGKVFYYRFRHTILFPVLSPEENILVTFNPPDSHKSGAYVRSQKAKGKLKQCAGTNKSLDGRNEIRRPPSARRLYDEAMEDGE